MSYEEWKAVAIAYMMSEYCLDENGIDDDWFRPDFAAGDTPQQSVDAFCEKYDLQRRSEFTIEDAVRVFSDPAYGLEDLKVGQEYAE